MLGLMNDFKLDVYAFICAFSIICIEFYSSIHYKTRLKIKKFCANFIAWIPQQAVAY